MKIKREIVKAKTMNDRFTDMGFSQGHQSCGGEPDISIWKIGETLS
jgi:hypothetical protein